MDRMRDIGVRSALRQEIRRIITEEYDHFDPTKLGAFGDLRRTVHHRTTALLDPKRLLGVTGQTIMGEDPNKDTNSFIDFLIREEHVRRVKRDLAEGRAVRHPAGDLYAELAARQGISREEAKRRHWGRMYGAGNISEIEERVYRHFTGSPSALMPRLEEFKRRYCYVPFSLAGIRQAEREYTASVARETEARNREELIRVTLRQVEGMLRSGTATVRYDSNRPMIDITLATDNYERYMPSTFGHRTMTITGRMVPEASLPPLHPNCRCVTTPVFPKEKTMKRKKFYVARPDGSLYLSDSASGFDKAPEATAAAKRQVEETGEEAVVLKVVAVAKRKTQPIVVESVK